MKRIGLMGRGVVGERILRRLPTVSPDLDIVDVDHRSGRTPPTDLDVLVLARTGDHAADAARALSDGVAVVSISDHPDDVRAMCDLDDEARHAGVPLVVGAGMSPGLSGLLARRVASSMATCDELHVALHGTAGPACARRHHRALRGRAIGYHDGGWLRRPAGSGRELCWFPEPVGAYDCYRAELASPMLLHRVFPDVERISARLSANRRDRFTAWLPMLRPPHREGGVGALRVEARGTDAHGARTTRIVGIAELVGTAAAATAGAFVVAATHDLLEPGVVVAGDASLPNDHLLRTVGRLGVRLQEFTGVPSSARVRSDP